MSPLTWEQLTDNVTSEKSVMNMEDCYSKARATSVGIFVGGFSGGLALQAQFHKHLPKMMKAFLIVPIACGLSLSLPAHRYNVRVCLAQWKKAEAAENCQACAKEEQKLPVSN